VVDLPSRIRVPAPQGFRVAVGGGLGRTPIIGHVIRECLPRAEILNYLDAILRVYNRFGRRDNKYKARIKILVKERTPAVFTRDVEAEWAQLRDGPATVPGGEFARLAASFAPRTGSGATCIRTRCRAMRSSRCRSRRPASRPAT
jgi:sulfite reductase beta subunit-like hemoprotein